ncbi:ABC transporter ATP-binding protein [Cerasicoccus arenae]|nr:ABC transporter ATP-binding protein [Cerasicoccus arenae]
MIEVNHISKRYRLGQIGAGSLREELSAVWQSLRGRSRKTADKNGNELRALDDVSFKVKTGEILGVIGHNGAGKSTLLKILSRITEPTSGEATLRGRVASLLEVGTGFHPELSGRDNIFLSGAVLGMSKDEIAQKFDRIVEFSEIGKFINTPIKRYSSGMTVRLGFAVAAHLDADILIVDEVLAVGDARFQEKCLNMIRSIQEDGRTIIFVSHNSSAIESLCTRAILLERGKIVADGPAHQVMRRYLQSEEMKIDGRVIINDGRLKLTSFNATYQYIDRSTCRIEFTILLDAKAAPPELYIDMALETQENVRVLQLVSLPHQYSAQCTGDKPVSITYTLECSPLKPGDYFATVYVHHPQLGPLLQVDRIKAISVIAQADYPECRSSGFNALLTVPFEFRQNHNPQS